ncbi:protein C12orf4 homolog [Cydia amplana]|uniref:protein C12orf4 homolog n=1 Tax=Cydia amplana TaxID=1869771 RepID=UPI002FE60B07
MTGEVVEPTTKTFKFSYPTCTNEDVFFHLEVPVQIPGARSGGRELVQRAMAMFHVPVYLEDELNEKLAQFIAEESKKFHDERDARLLAALRGGEGGGRAEGAVKRWEKRFKEHVREYAEQKDTSDEEVFAAMYHKLVHSPALEAVLRAEAGYAAAVRAAAAARDADVKQLTQRQTEEMEQALRNLNVTTTEEQINALAVRQFEEQALAAARWGSQLDALAHAQRAQHRAHLAHALHQQASPPSSPLSPLAGRAPSAGGGGGAGGAGAHMQESFTIHLGSQLKQTHNIRIVAMDVEDLFDTSGDSSWDGPRLQTALALYSGELAGAVLLCQAGGCAPPAPPGALLAAATTTDHHFPPLDQQLRTVAERSAEPIEKRNAARHSRSVASAAGSAPSPAGPAPSPAGPAPSAPRPRRGPATGDVFVTRHSNLPDAHVVFHLVINDDTRESGEMTSRHPAILGLRSVLQGASNNDVTSLALPLLLRHELTEEMTAAWIVRRAELVLKCVKGFMLEAAGGGGAQLRTLTLHAPRGLAPPVFSALRALLPAVFRISTPLKIKPRE